MRKLLLMDFSNIAYATYYSMGAYMSDEYDTEEEQMRIWKHMMLNSIRKNKMKHNPTEYIICADSKSWRRKAFQFYKAKRDQVKKESDIDIRFFIETMNSFLDDLREHFPYPVIKLNGAEADDIIAVLSETLRGSFDQVVIASNDKDFKQLVNGNIKLWSMREEKWIEVGDTTEYLITHILKGDASDGIPNVRSADEVFITDGMRQKPCGPKLIGKILEQGVQEWIDENDLRRNYNRNRKLIELSREAIPMGLWEKVVDIYKEYDRVKPNYTKIMGYFVKNRMRQLCESINQFM